MTHYDTDRLERFAHVSGPHTEYGPSDRPTGATYFRCEACGREGLSRDTILHRDDCPLVR